MADPVVRVLDFEGPLDLLIHLIEKNKMDIYDIPIVSITDQYISYLHSFTETDLEAASQFLVMASLLLQIKSRMLLPKTELEDEDEADPRDMLVQMLLEYRCIKAVAKQLETMKQTAARQQTDGGPAAYPQAVFCRQQTAEPALLSGERAAAGSGRPVRFAAAADRGCGPAGV